MANTLLVLGNGFDKRCGLKSSFKDYITSKEYEERKKICMEAIKFIKETGRTCYVEPQNIGQLYEYYKNITFWDLYFAGRYFINFEKTYMFNKWFNFEERMKEFIQEAISSIDNKHTVFDKIIDCKWHILSDLEIKNTEIIYNLLLKLYIDYIEQSNDCSAHLVSLGTSLLKQLKSYESLFGIYIKKQQDSNSDYTRKAKEIVKSLIGPDNTLVCLDTFNYSDMSDVVGINCPIWHINGDIENPIFGIDLPLPQPSRDKKPLSLSDLSSATLKEWYRFTKTYRRLELDRKAGYAPTKTDFTRVVVYGHSLNEQDYNYFFSLFNRMGFTALRDIKDKYEIEFRYSAHDNMSDEEVKRELIDSALAMFQNYNNEVLHEPNFRLMDILYGNGAIKFIKAESIAFI